MIRHLLALAMTAGLASSALAADGPPELAKGAKIADFGFHFIDTSTEGAYNGPREDEAARLALLDKTLKTELQDRGYAIVSLDPVRDTLEGVTNPAKCNGCSVDMARTLNADYAVVGEIQKVSNLILSMNLAVRDAGTGETVRALAVDIRGNTDESWLRGLRYILKNGIFKQ